MIFERVSPNILSVYQYNKKVSASNVTQHKFQYSYKIIVLLEGTIILNADSVKHNCSEGDIIYIPVRRDYITEFPPGPLSTINIEFDMINDRTQCSKARNTYFSYIGKEKNNDEFSTFAVFDNLTLFNNCTVIHNFPAITKRMERLLKLRNSEEKYSNLILNAKFTELLVDIARYADNGKKLRHSVLVEQVIDYVKMHVTEKISCKKVADAFSYHPSALNRIMKEFCGCSLHEIIMQEKINMAIKLLLNNEMSVTDIAYHLSFYDSAHFTNTFKEFTGKTPSDIQKGVHSNDK